MKQIVFGFRQRLYVVTISMASMTIFCGCLYWYFLYSGKPTLEDIFSIVFYIFAAIVTVECATFWIRSFIKACRSKPSSKNTEWLEATTFNNELSELAQKVGVGLNSSEKLGIMKDFGDARFTSKGQLVVGDRLWNKLNNKERLALAAHEFAHSKRRHERRLVIFSLVAAIVAAILTLVAPLAAMIIFIVTIVPPLFVKISFLIAAVCIASLIVSYQNEYAADLLAVEFLDGDSVSVMSMVEQLAESDQQSWQTLSHPSVKNRIQNILKQN